jgi:putative component of toxin-antitoxin plasmid stabilization module
LRGSRSRSTGALSSLEKGICELPVAFREGLRLLFKLRWQLRVTNDCFGDRSEDFIPLDDRFRYARAFSLSFRRTLRCSRLSFLHQNLG